MKHLSLIVATALVCAVAVPISQSTAPREANLSPSFQAFLTQFEQGIGRFINGDASLWKQNASRADDVTLMGGWGTYEKGWKNVGARYDWAAARFRDSGASVKVAYLSSAESGDVAYTVTIERSVASVAGQAKPAPMALRVTQLFPRERGEWRLIHRHADPLLETTSEGSVLQKK
jgi:ketosteroid isomerase-like protein